MTYWVWSAGVLAGGLVLAALIAVAGATYQIIGERGDRKSTRRPAIL